ncbi:CHAP domain-containing protein [Lactococcus sp.]|uniref:CHAP domain-containing protein n=1 Tax=Lactococcus sp. TaxID=44273 RepID=UPI0035AE9687
MDLRSRFITAFKEQKLNNTVHIKKITHQVLLASSIVGAVGLATQLSVKADATTSNTYTTVYRLYNTQTKEHLYTTNWAEINGLPKASSAWVKEGIAFQEPTKSNTPVYRLVNTKTNEHYFTADNALANKMITEGAKDGWQNDTSLPAYQHDTNSKTIAFYSADATVENLPVLSLQNSKAGIGQHFYTTSTSEAEVAKTQFDWKKTGSFDQKEGVAWYALGQATSDGSTTSVNQEAASNFPIPDVPYGWSISSPIDTTNYSSATYDYRQCTWFAWNRARQLGITYSPYMGNGQDWQNDAGYTVTTTPVVHSVVSFKAGQFGFSAQYGHVAFVEAVNPDGSILVSESGLGYSSLYVYQVFTAQEAAQLHYVIGQ